MVWDTLDKEQPRLGMLRGVVQDLEGPCRGVFRFFTALK